LGFATCFYQTVLEAATVIKSFEGLLVSTWKQKRSVMRRYDLTSEMYDSRYSAEQQEKYIAALDCLVLSPECALLDVGCGSGLFIGSVAGEDRVVVGIDVSRKLLLHAKKRVDDKSNVFLVLADADHLPIRAGFFDFVFWFTVLQNMPKPLTTLEETKRVAKHGARFVITGLKRAVSLETLGGLLEKAGLEVVSLRDDETLCCYVVVSVQK
jgi:ubiquinone/menaquinone biosynthesis C-methylase UbiE